jgi:hypothetical protein
VGFDSPLEHVQKVKNLCAFMRILRNGSRRKVSTSLMVIASSLAVVITTHSMLVAEKSMMEINSFGLYN